MVEHELFTVRETLFGPGEPRERFKRCLVEAKRFIEATSIADILNLAFDLEENRRTVMESVSEILHVGFIVPKEGLSFDCMVSASDEAGFCSDHATFPSAVVARELGELEGCEQIPTTFFTAGTEETHGRVCYFEAFIPSTDPELVGKWIEEEVGTHVGLTLADPSTFTKVQAAFQAEGYRMPLFMRGEPITNFDNEVTVAYYEKRRGEQKVRIEVVFSPDGAGR
jgi:hypothetical protein